jgi:ribosomal protein S18 acetylase RimI-like enzyme
VAVSGSGRPRAAPLAMAGGGPGRTYLTRYDSLSYICQESSGRGYLLQSVVVSRPVTATAYPARLLKLREMRPRDLRVAAQIHHACLHHGLFPQLGKRFLRAYLATFMASPHAVALVAVTHGSPVGFLVGTFEDRRHYRFVLRRHGLRLALAGSAALALRPRLAWRFVHTRARRYASGFVRLSGGAVAVPATLPVGGDGVLTHVAVAPDGRGRGAGAGLVDEFVERARARGVSEVRLVTRAGPDGAGAFYARLGWRVTGVYRDRDGLSWVRYRLELW